MIYIYIYICNTINTCQPITQWWSRCASNRVQLYNLSTWRPAVISIVFRAHRLKLYNAVHVQKPRKSTCRPITKRVQSHPKSTCQHNTQWLSSCANSNVGPTPQSLSSSKCSPICRLKNKFDATVANNLQCRMNIDVGNSIEQTHTHSSADISMSANDWICEQPSHAHHMACRTLLERYDIALKKASSSVGPSS